MGCGMFVYTQGMSVGDCILMCGYIVSLMVPFNALGAYSSDLKKTSGRDLKKCMELKRVYLQSEQMPQRNMKINIINGSEVSRLSVAIHVLILIAI
ncbi:hypothetical protein EPW57_22320 [Salmonella enterica]|nr:hypothetical protein [Salmonella enterica]